MHLIKDQSNSSVRTLKIFCAHVMFVLYYVYVLLLFVLYLIMFYRILPHTLSPSFWNSGAYALVLAYATRARDAFSWGVGLPPPLLSHVFMYYVCFIATILCIYVSMYVSM